MISLSKSNCDHDPIPMISQICPRIVFRTASRKISDLLEESHPYNQVKFIMIIIRLMIIALMITVGSKLNFMITDGLLSSVGHQARVYAPLHLRCLTLPGGFRIMNLNRPIVVKVKGSGSWDDYHLHYDQQYQQHHPNPQVQ